MARLSLPSVIPVPDTPETQKALQEYLRDVASSLRRWADLSDIFDTFTFTATGMTTAPTGTGRFAKSGRVVTLHIPAITGTSNAATYTLTGLPGTVTPQSEQQFMCATQDNGAAFVAAIGKVKTNGTVEFFKDANSGAFTAAGVKSNATISVSYILD